MHALAMQGGLGMSTMNTASVYQPSAATTQRKVLIVEDSPLVLMSLEGLIDDMDWLVEGPAMRLAEALDLAAVSDSDVALLDINLDGEMSFAVADRLLARGVPVVFMTGYDNTAMVPDHLKAQPMVAKPFAIVELEAMLRRIVGDAD